MSYCEGVTGRLRPLSAPLTPGPHLMFEETRSVKLSRCLLFRLITFNVDQVVASRPRLSASFGSGGEVRVCLLEAGVRGSTEQRPSSPAQRHPQPLQREEDLPTQPAAPEEV